MRAVFFCFGDADSDGLDRPGFERKIDGAVEGVAAMAAGGLHCESIHHADEEERQGRHIGVRRKIAFAACAFETLAHLGNATFADGCHLLADGFALGAGDKGSLDPEAAAGISGVGGHGDRAAEQHLGNLARLGLAKRAAHVAPGTCAVARHRFAEEFGLVSEGGVEARAIDAHGGGQRGKRRAFISLPPEDAHGGIEGQLAVEGPRAPWLRLT